MSDGGQTNAANVQVPDTSAAPLPNDPDTLPMETVEVDAPAPTVDDDHQHATDQGFKNAFRDHARWAMREMQLCDQGKTIAEREQLNP